MYYSFNRDECPADHPYRALKGITDELQILSEHSNTVDYQENEADGSAISKLSGDIRDAIIEYQVSPSPPVTCGMHYSDTAVHPTEVNVRTKWQIDCMSWLFVDPYQKLTSCHRTQVR